MRRVTYSPPTILCRSATATASVPAIQSATSYKCFSSYPNRIYRNETLGSDALEAYPFTKRVRISVSLLERWKP